MNDKFRKTVLTKKKTIIVVATTAYVVGVSLYIRHKTNVRVTEACANAVCDWVNANEKAGFKVFLLNEDLSKAIFTHNGLELSPIAA